MKKTLQILSFLDFLESKFGICGRLWNNDPFFPFDVLTSFLSATSIQPPEINAIKSVRLSYRSISN